MPIEDNIDPSKYSFEIISDLRSQLMELERKRNLLQDNLNNIHKYPSNARLLDIIQERKEEMKTLTKRLHHLEEEENPENEKIIEELIESRRLAEKELAIRTRMSLALLGVIKESVNPKSLHEFLVCFFDKFIFKKTCASLKYTNIHY
ncbi:Hop2p NDAI_0D03740 [Naumovozyma dairenensis CBS 421]|uniref:Uncharacterized protein n=1 Tax=Naumovozyma dairenensis (strain ATCC 10597 / BCRC 20456 / CBS 421 / NBRC 0211 / NRRL Y-12639) TaxID=1071378 RepID=G0WA77_NAUDC|nr:hypothetical protein NDAI_0D03740 [Naumovozyma dairenensis CBS 421]CCD24688.1 hypothetical protein NDAI_0D03740 [Naumovozyma dairenensis CBS 421]